VVQPIELDRDTRVTDEGINYLNSLLNDRGEEGWELVGTTSGQKGYMLWFKRPTSRVTCRGPRALFAPETPSRYPCT
jgi:hypothetical protein